MNRNLAIDAIIKMQDGLKDLAAAFAVDEPGAESAAAEPKAAKAKKETKDAKPKAAPKKSAKVEVEEDEDDDLVESDEDEVSLDDEDEEDLGDDEDLEAGEDDAPKVKTVTPEQIREALISFSKANGKEKAYATLEKHGGARKVADCDPKKFPAVMKALTKK